MSKKERFTRWYRKMLNSNARFWFLGTIILAFVGAMWCRPLYWSIIGYSFLSVIWELTWNRKYK